MTEKEVKVLVTTETDVSSLEDLESTLDEAKSKADELGESLTDATEDVDSTGVDELDTSLEEASGSAEDLNDSLSGIDGSGLDDASGSASDLASSLDEASNSADTLSGALESASYMGMAEGVGQYADGAENLAQSMNTAAISVGQLATQAGMAEPQMVSLINNISNATFPQEEAMQYVQALNQMGVSANELGASATNMDRINDAFHLGASNVVQLTNNLGVLGVSANNLDSSFNALAYAQSNITGGVDRFNTVLQRLGPSFSEYGYNVDQAAIITAAATQKWGTGRKSMTELSNAMKECKGDTAALEQALGLQAGALSNASSITGQYSGQLQNLAGEEAEHKSWLDQINAAWEDMSLALSPVLSPMASLLGLIGQFGQFALAINSIVTLAQTFKTLELANLALIPSQIAEGIAGWFSVGWMILAVAIILAVIAAFIYLYNTNEDFRAFIDGLIGGFMEFCQVISDNVIGALEWLQGAFQNTINFITTYGQLFVQAFFVMATGGIGAIALLIANMNGMPNQLGAILQTAIGRVVSFAGSLVSNFVSAAANAVNNFLSRIRQMPVAFAQELNKMIQQAIDFASRLPQIIGDAARRALAQWFGITGEGSPGYIYYAFEEELGAMENISKNNHIARNIGATAVNMLENWGNPEFDYTVAGTMDMESGVTGSGAVEGLLNRILESLTNPQGNGSVTFNLYGDIDSEERMQRFIDAVRRDLEWNNNTSGRTV